MDSQESELGGGVETDPPNFFYPVFAVGVGCFPVGSNPPLIFTLLDFIISKKCNDIGT